MDNPILTTLRRDAFSPVRSGNDIFTTANMLAFLRRNWMRILTGAIAGQVFGFILAFSLPSYFTAETQVLLQPMINESVGSPTSLDSGYIDTQITLIESYELLERVATALDLFNDKDFSEHWSPSRLVAFGSADESLAEDATNLPAHIVIANLREAIEVGRVRRSQVLSISVTSQNSAKAAKIANSLADTFVSYRLDKRSPAEQTSAEWIAERTEALRDNVRRAERELDELKREDNVGDGGLAAVAGRSDSRLPTPSTTNRHRQLEQVIAARQAQLQQFLENSQRSAELINFGRQNARVISPAVEPLRASFPKKRDLLITSLLLGLLTGAAISVATEALQSGFLTPNQIVNTLGLSVIAVIPNFKAIQRADKANSSSIALLDSFTSARVDLDLRLGAKRQKIVLVTSSVSQEGRSTIALHLAESAARCGKRVLLIEADVRRPSLGRSLAINLRHGLVDVLRRSLPFEQAVTRRESIDILLAGRLSDTSNTGSPSDGLEPADLLSSDRMKDLLAELAETYDYVFMDTPPLIPYVDAKILTALVDVVVFVVRWRTTPTYIAKQALDSVAADPRRPVAILNRADIGVVRRYSS